MSPPRLPELSDVVLGAHTEATSEQVSRWEGTVAETFADNIPDMTPSAEAAYRRMVGVLQELGDDEKSADSESSASEGGGIAIEGEGGDQPDTIASNAPRFSASRTISDAPARPIMRQLGHEQALTLYEALLNMPCETPRELAGAVTKVTLEISSVHPDEGSEISYYSTISSYQETQDGSANHDVQPTIVPMASEHSASETSGTTSQSTSEGSEDTVEA